jgi:hypothetical protein
MVMRRRVGRPLLRTAVVGGAAYMAGSAVANRSAAQRQQDTAQDAQIAQLQEQAAMSQQTDMRRPETPTPAPAARDPMEQLRQLGELKAAGVLTDAEFEVKKAELLRQI